MQTILGLFNFAVIFNVLMFHSLFAANTTMLGPQLAGNSSGVVAIWSAFNGTEYGIYQAKLPTAGSWSSAVQISASRVNCLNPSIAMNSSGSILSAWKKASGTISDIQLAINTFANITATVVSTASFYGSEHIPCSTPVARLDNAGNGTVVWEGHSSSGYVMLGTECTTSNLRSPVITLSSLNPQPVHADLVVQIPSGTSFVVWQEPINGVQAIQAASVTLDGQITGPVSISSSTHHNACPYLSLSSNGSVYAAWWENINPYSTLKATAISNDLSVSVSTLVLDGVNLMRPRISANASGNILLVADATLSNGNTAVAAAAKVSGTWSNVSILSDPSTTSITEPMVHLNNSGQGAAVWQDTSSDNGVIWAAVYSSGAWSSPMAISSPSLNCSAPALYVDPTGYAVAAWIAESSTEGIIFSTQSSTLSSFGGSWSMPTTISSP